MSERQLGAHNTQDGWSKRGGMLNESCRIEPTHNQKRVVILLISQKIVIVFH